MGTKTKIRFGYGDYQEPSVTSNSVKIGDKRNCIVGFYPGHQISKKENYTHEANQGRLRGLLKTYEVKARIHAGEKVMTVNAKKAKIRRKRLRLREHAAKEYREIQEIARRQATEAMNRLSKIIQDPNSQDTSAIAAAQVILDRAYGKANQTNINATVDMNGKTNEIGTKELDQRVAKALERIEAITGRAPAKKPSQEQSPDLRKLN